MHTVAKDNMNWITSIEGILTALGSLATAFVSLLTLTKVLQKRRARRVQRGILDSITAGSKVATELNRITHDLPVSRAHLIQCKNGGGIPKRGSDLNITVRYENATSALPFIRDRVRAMPTDTPYEQMLGHMMSEGFVVLRTDALSDGWLKRLYESQGVRCGFAHLVGFSSTSMYYLASQMPADPTDEEVDRVRVVMSASANNIANLMNLSRLPLT